MKKKLIKRSTQIAISLVVLMVLLVRLNGYSFTESDAITSVNSKYNNKILYSKEFGDIKLLITSGDFAKNLIAIKKKWGFLHKVTHTTNMARSESHLMNRAWTGTSIANEFHETVYCL